VKLLKGKRLTPVMRVGNQSFGVGSVGGIPDRKAGLWHYLCSEGCTFSFAGQHQFLPLDKTPREGSSLGCVIALGRYSGGD
jgi:hypothetical protein